MDIKQLRNSILLSSSICGISSDEVQFAKNLVDNKVKNTNLFVCEGLWAVDKLIEKKLKVTAFYYNSDKFNADLLDEATMQKIAKMASYAEKTYAISEKACKKISDRDGYDEYFIVVEAKKYTFEDLEKQIIPDEIDEDAF